MGSPSHNWGAHNYILMLVNSMELALEGLALSCSYISLLLCSLIREI